MNFYNEHDPKAAAWLRELIKHGHIPAGIVDERSIEDIIPSELAEFTQCHFFAGIGGWSLALRLAGWPEDRPVWTGSCPCQPFSTAGKGGGFADERHLWPAWHHLISQRQPPVIIGEQVASRAALEWFDLVHDDLEASGYAVGATDLCAAGIGAPHIRQRLWWVADRIVAGLEGHCRDGYDRHQPGRVRESPAGSTPARRPANRMADASSREEHKEQREPSEAQGGWVSDLPSGCSVDCRMGDAKGNEQRRTSVPESHREWESLGGSSGNRWPGPLHGFWRDADWLHCRDGKWRPVEPGTFPLAHGVSCRVVRLRGYGNAIVPQVAAEFIRAYLETQGGITLTLPR